MKPVTSRTNGVLFEASWHLLLLVTGAMAFEIWVGYSDVYFLDADYYRITPPGADGGPEVQVFFGSLCFASLRQSELLGLFPVCATLTVPVGLMVRKMTSLEGMFQSSLLGVLLAGLSVGALLLAIPELSYGWRLFAPLGLIWLMIGGPIAWRIYTLRLRRASRADTFLRCFVATVLCLLAMNVTLTAFRFLLESFTYDIADHFTGNVARIRYAKWISNIFPMYKAVWSAESWVLFVSISICALAGFCLRKLSWDSLLVCFLLIGFAIFFVFLLSHSGHQCFAIVLQACLWLMSLTGILVLNPLKEKQI
jgi:hypothetical protein